MSDSELPDSIAENSHGDWIDVLRTNGFEIERLIEPQAPPDAMPHSYYDYVPPAWAWKWPHEEIWVGRRAGNEGSDRRPTAPSP